MSPPMVLAADRLLARPTDVVEQTWTLRDTVTYNLGIGFGATAVDDPTQLRFVLEEQLVAFPTIAAVLGIARKIYYDTSFGIDFAGILHGEESCEIFKPLPAAGTLIGRTRIVGLWDRGPEKGAIMCLEKNLHDPKDDSAFASTRMTLMLRRNGGFGGSAEGAPKAATLPDRTPDGSLVLATRPEQALIYRLSGDTNPLHAVPDAAMSAGFPKPILHGLCTYGIAARALVQNIAKGDETRFKSFSVRFSNPTFPGETLRTEYWALGDDEYAFRCVALERNAIVLTGGRARVAHN